MKLRQQRSDTSDDLMVVSVHIALQYDRQSCFTVWKNDKIHLVITGTRSKVINSSFSIARAIVVSSVSILSVILSSNSEA